MGEIVGEIVAEIAEQARAFADRLDVVLAGWVIRCVDRAYRAWSGASPPATVRQAAEAAGAQAQADVGARLRAVLEADIDEQRTTPLAVLREAVRYPTDVLAAAGVPPVARDDYALAAFPADEYGLTPGSLADLDPQLAELGLAWGAAKAWAHRRRHGRA